MARMSVKMRDFFFAVAFVFLLTFPVEASEVVVDVSARVESSGRLPPLIQKRMEASVRTISEELFVGSSIERVTAQQAAYENIVRQVFDKILVGYSVKKVVIESAPKTKVLVELTPWAETIHDVQLLIDVEGLPPEIKTLAIQDLAGVDEVFRQSLQGLPVDATDWSNGVLKRSLNEYMEANLPEFRADFDLDPGAVARIKMVVYPKGPVIRTIDLQMRSDTVPNLMLLECRSQLQKRADMMLGVPVAFVARHTAYFQQVMEETIDQTADFKFLKLRSVIDLRPGERTTVISRSDTNKYRIRLEGRLDMGRGSDENRSTSFNAHAGVMFSPKDEVFAQAEFYPQDVEAVWYSGYNRDIGNGNTIGWKYNISEDDYVLGAARKFDERWLLRYEYAHDTRLGEIGLRYKLHDFISLEYILNKEDGWLRLIGNF
jgi:hypothetical protein